MMPAQFPESRHITINRDTGTVEIVTTKHLGETVIDTGDGCECCRFQAYDVTISTTTGPMPIERNGRIRFAVEPE